LYIILLIRHINIVHHFVNSGSTVNLCVLDLSKACDRDNNSAVYIKVKKRRLTVKLLDLLVYWLDNCSLTHRVLNGVGYYYKSSSSSVFRQGSVLSPIVFA